MSSNVSFIMQFDNLLINNKGFKIKLCLLIVIIEPYSVNISTLKTLKLNSNHF